MNSKARKIALLLVIMFGLATQAIAQGPVSAEADGFDAKAISLYREGKTKDVLEAATTTLDNVPVKLNGKVIYNFVAK